MSQGQLINDRQIKIFEQKNSSSIQSYSNRPLPGQKIRMAAYAIFSKQIVGYDNKTVEVDHQVIN